MGDKLIDILNITDKTPNPLQGMDKLITIPPEIIQDLKILAVKANKDLKNYIQDELVKIVEASRKG